MDLDHHSLLPSICVSDLGNTIAWTANFQEYLALDGLLLWSDLKLAVLHVASGTSRKVSLMLLSLSVSQIGAFIGVKGQTETTFQ